MKAISPACVILPFPRQTFSARTPGPTVSHPDLIELAAPKNPHAADAIWLLGENILLPTAGESGFHYAACVHVVTDGGRKALPVLSRRVWSRPPLSATAGDHAVWFDLAAGLAEAARRVADTAVSLHGAVSIARSWANHRLAAISTQPSSALLLNHETHVFCDALPLGLPPKSAATATSRILPFVNRSVELPLLLAA